MVYLLSTALPPQVQCAVASDSSESTGAASTNVRALPPARSRARSNRFGRVALHASPALNAAAPPSPQEEVEFQAFRTRFGTAHQAMLPPFAPEKPAGDDRSVLVWAPDTATAGPPLATFDSYLARARDALTYSPPLPSLARDALDSLIKTYEIECGDHIGEAVGLPVRQNTAEAVIVEPAGMGLGHAQPDQRVLAHVLDVDGTDLAGIGAPQQIGRDRVGVVKAESQNKPGIESIDTGGRRVSQARCDDRIIQQPIQALV